MRVVLADDSVLLREGLARLLWETGFEVVGQAGTKNELLGLIGHELPDIAIVDIRMPPTYSNEGLEAAEEIRAKHPSVGVLVLSQYVDSGCAIDLISRGTRGVGYLLKDRVSDLAEFADSVRRVGAGGSVIDAEIVSRLLERRPTLNALHNLTEREQTVLMLMAEGRSNQAIAEKLSLSAKTVEAHVRSIFTKLDLMPTLQDNRRVLAVVSYLRSGVRGPNS